MATPLALVIVLLCPGLLVSQRIASEGELVHTLLARYQNETASLARPVKNAAEPVIVRFRPSFRKIMDIDEKKQELSIYLWRTHIWKDEYLTWNPSDYGGLNRTRLNANKVWTPDIVLFNSVNAGLESKDGDSNGKLIVHHDGSVQWIPRVIEKSMCDIGANDFPFDEQHCFLKYGSWSLRANELQLDAKEEADMSEFHHHTEWEVIGNSVKNQQTKYECCEEMFEDVNYEIILRRKPAFLARFMLLPAILLSLMLLVIFWIPPQRPDRTSLAMSLFTSFMLLLLLLVNYTPPTSQSKLASFYCYDIIGVAIAVFLSIIVVNLAHKKTRMSPYLLKLLKRLELVLCLDVHPPSDANTDWIRFARVLDRMFFILYVVYFVLVFSLVFPFCKSSNQIIWL